MKRKKKKEGTNTNSDKAPPTLPFFDNDKFPQEKEEPNTPGNSDQEKIKEKNIQVKQKNNMDNTEMTISIIQTALNAAYVIVTIIIASITFSSLNETRKSNNAIKEQFELENTPFITVDSPVVKGFTEEVTKVDYEIINLNKFPIQITSNQTDVIAAENEKDAWDKINLLKLVTEKTYLGSNPKHMASGNSPVSKDDFEKITQKKKNLYFFGKIIYFNPSFPKKKRKLIFILRLDPAPHAVWENIENENSDL